MDCVSPILDIAACIWDCSAKRAVYIQELEKNLNSLRNEMVELKNRGEDVRRRVELAEQQQMMRRRESGWLAPKCRSYRNYKTGKMVRRKLDAVFKLKNKGSFDVVAYRVPSSLVDERPMEKTVGLDLTYERVCSCLKDGKWESSAYMEWGWCPNQQGLKKFRKSFETNYRSKMICGKIEPRMKRLQKYGRVPLPNDQNMSKIVFTTRLENVCHQMRAQERIKLECLESTEALALFLKECKGLPLALITIGRAMASMNGPLAWEQAIQELRKFPAEIIGMEDDLFYRLKFSYDSLCDEVLKSCFIYCSMFPEDYEIENDALIELWIGEGFWMNLRTSMKHVIEDIKLLEI
ncbi:putative disease resistance protein [Vitis vinifera]|uniref:Putative disease resistance protein n=1 Tax=Vitis vinifera TaxID=29760 RepID=A0A438HB27_VITVI|nr:putative disease resistance protein [Vitis vinifera]